MTADPSFTESPASDSTWHQLDELIDEMAALARADLAPREFWRRLLDRTARALAAVGGIVWLRAANESFELLCQQTLLPSSWAEALGDPRRRGPVLQHVAQTGLAVALPPGGAPGGAADTDNPSDLLLLLSPVMVEGEARAIVEIFERPSELPTAAKGYLQFLTAVCELAADYCGQHQLRELRDRATSWNKVEDFSRAVHGSLELKSVAGAIANDGRSLIGCDRVSVAMLKGHKARIVSVSGVEAPDRRAASMRLLEALLGAVVAVDEPLWHPADAGQLPPQIEQALEAYLDESHARQVTIIPLHRQSIDAKAKSDQPETEPRSETIGALVVEDFSASADRSTRRQQVETVAAHAALALTNAAVYESVPLVSLWRMLGHARSLTRGRGLAKSLAVLGAVAAVVAALLFVQVDFTVDGRGELLPERRREIFAPIDAIIDQILVKHGDEVTAGQPLLVLRKPELDFEMTRVSGEIQTARKRLAGLQASRLSGAAASAEAREQFHQRTAEQEEVKELLRSLEAQGAVLKKQSEELTIRSPIAGMVLTWDVSQILETRPVERGQRLLRVADLAGPWELELRIADDRIGYVLGAEQGADSGLDVSFLLATASDKTYEARVRNVSLATDVIDSGPPQVLVTATLDHSAIERLRPGAEVLANVHCGRRSLGFVWLHDIWDAFQTRVLF